MRKIEIINLKTSFTQNKLNNQKISQNPSFGNAVTSVEKQSIFLDAFLSVFRNPLKALKEIKAVRADLKANKAKIKELKAQLHLLEIESRVAKETHFLNASIQMNTSILEMQNTTLKLENQIAGNKLEIASKVSDIENQILWKTIGVPGDVLLGNKNGLKH